MGPGKYSEVIYKKIVARKFICSSGVRHPEGVAEGEGATDGGKGKGETGVMRKKGFLKGVGEKMIQGCLFQDEPRTRGRYEKEVVSRKST